MGVTAAVVGYLGEGGFCPLPPGKGTVPAMGLPQVYFAGADLNLQVGLCGLIHRIGFGGGGHCWSNRTPRSAQIYPPACPKELTITGSNAYCRAALHWILLALRLGTYWHCARTGTRPIPLALEEFYGIFVTPALVV